MKNTTIPTKPVDHDRLRLERIRAYNEAQYDAIDDYQSRADNMVAIVILAAASAILLGLGVLFAYLILR